MKISIIAALSSNKVIGKDNKLPWHIPEDLQYFKKITFGKPIIMGRKTFDSMGRRLLPGRKTIIISRNKQEVSGATVVDSIDAALKVCDAFDEVMVVGGANVYAQFLPIADRLYLSVIPGVYEGDTFFPNYDEKNWDLVSRENNNNFMALIYERNRRSL